MPEDKHDSICAWGTCKPKMVELCKKSGVDFENYVIHNGKNMHVEMNNNEKYRRLLTRNSFPVYKIR
jgi:hypothetical protein